MPSSQEATSLATLLIQKCGTTNSLQKSRQIHARILTAKPPIRKSPYLINNLLSMYSRCGSIVDAQIVFDEMPQRTIVSYNALISSYSRSPNSGRLAFKLLTQLNLEGFTPNGPTFTSLLQASSCLEDIVLGSGLHTQIIKFEFSNDTLVQTSLLGMYSSCGDLDSSKKVFNSIIEKDATAWNSIIFAHMKNNKIMQGLYIFQDMLKIGPLPTQFTYSMILNACSKLLDHEPGQLIHTQIIVSGIPPDLPLKNALLNMYCSCGNTQMAAKVFSDIKNPDLVSWNSILSGFLTNGDVENSIKMFIHLYKGSFVKPDDYTFAIIISATRSLPCSTYGNPLHAQVIKSGFEINVYVASTLVSMYFQNGDTESAKKIQTLIPIKDLVFWTEMITGYTRMGDGENAIKCFKEMFQEHKNDSFSLSIVMSACTDLASKNQGEMIHCLVIKLGFDSEMNVCGSLIDMYSKTGDLGSSESVLSRVKKSLTPDLKCWNAILSGYGHHGRGDEAFRIFNEIIKQGLIPDEVTYLSMLAACNHCGWVDKGQWIWRLMKENGLIIGSKHYSCLIGLLSRAGLLNEAWNMIINSRFGEFNLELWRCLLSSCVDRRNIDIGLRVIEKIEKCNEEDGAVFVLMTNLYALMGRWDDVARMRRKIRGLGFEKDPGLSWIELTTDTRVFSSGDRSYSEVDEVEGELLSLQRNLAKQEVDVVL